MCSLPRRNYSLNFVQIYVKHVFLDETSIVVPAALALALNDM